VAAPGLTLKSALSSDFITFWYQPKVDLLKRRVVGAEAFARIAHPQHGIIAPVHFLARADDDDIIELAKRAIVSTLKFSAKLDELGVALQLGINVDYDTLAKCPVSELVARHRPRNEQWPGLVIEMPEAQLLNKVGGDIRISTLQRAGQTLYRVRSGPLPSVADADAALARITGAGANDAHIVVDQ